MKLERLRILGIVVIIALIAIEFGGCAEKKNIPVINYMLVADTNTVYLKVRVEGR